MPDFIEAGTAGPVVMLLHSAVSGAKMWRRIVDALKDRYRVRAVNLIGYGETPAWNNERSQTLEESGPRGGGGDPRRRGVALSRRAFFWRGRRNENSGAPGRAVAKLILLEANPCYLLRLAGRDEANAQAIELRNCIKAGGDNGDWETAAATFADYWGGPGTWAGMSAERRETFIVGLRPNYHEWDTYPHWKFCQIASGGHMAPLKRPDLTNPLIAQFLDD
jgi:hypothetical protein